MGIVTVEVKNFFNKESVLWKFQQRTLSVEVKWKRSARNSVFPASASPHLCLDLSRQCAFLQFWPWDSGTISFCETLWKRLKMPHCLEFELSSLFSGTRLPSGGIPGCLRIVFNLFVATRPLFLSHTWWRQWTRRGKCHLGVIFLTFWNGTLVRKTQMG